MKHVRQLEKGGGKRIVEFAGYVSPSIRIAEMIGAGQRLQAARLEAYDFPDGQDDGSPVDPTRRPGLDLAEASQMQQQLKDNIVADHKAAVAKRKKAAKVPPVVPPEQGANAIPPP